jgi:cation diffusion facilitator family transporter
MDRKKAQIVEGVLSVVVNAALFVIKIWVGIVTGSIAFIADAWHTLSDSLTSILVIVSANLSSKKPDKEHPFGHGRWEQISSIFIAFFLGIVGYQFFILSLERFQARESVYFGTLAIVVIIISIGVKEFLAQYAFYLGRKTNNIIIEADGWHHRSDSLSSAVILAGIIISRIAPQIWWMDSVLGLFCAIAIFYAALKILKGVITKLLGEEPDQEVIEKIRKEAKNLFGDSLELHHFHLHNYITQQELTLHIRLSRNMTIEEGHKIATTIESMIKNQFDIVATIHVEPWLTKPDILPVSSRDND